MTYTSAIIAVSSGNILRDPSIKDISAASSLHVLAVASTGFLLLNESEGEFDLETWEAVADQAQVICQGSEGDASSDNDISMVEDGETKHQGLEGSVRDIVADKIQHDQAWRIATT